MKGRMSTTYIVNTTLFLFLILISLLNYTNNKEINNLRKIFVKGSKEANLSGNAVVKSVPTQAALVTVAQNAPSAPVNKQMKNVLI